MNTRPLGLLIAAFVLLPAASAPAQRTRIITGPSATYQRGFSPSFPAAAGFSYQAGFAAPVVVPNFATVPSLGPNGTPRPVPYLSSPGYGYGYGYDNTYPGYGFGFGGGYGFGSGYGYGYPGFVYGFNSAGALYPSMPMGVYAPPRVIIENGYYRR